MSTEQEPYRQAFIRLRRDLGLSRADFAKGLKCSEREVREYETGYSKFPPDHCDRHIWLAFRREVLPGKSDYYRRHEELCAELNQGHESTKEGFLERVKRIIAEEMAAMQEPDIRDVPLRRRNPHHSLIEEFKLGRGKVMSRIIRTGLFDPERAWNRW